MESVLQFLNNNSGAFSVVFALVVAVATVFYAVLTSQLVSETRRMRAAQTEPNVLVWAEPSQERFADIYLTIENIGNGTAHDIKVSVDHDYEWAKGFSVSRLGLVKHGLRSLGPRQRLRYFLMPSPQKERSEGAGQAAPYFTVTTRYRGPYGDSYQAQFPIDLDQFTGLSGGRGPLHELVESVDQLRSLFQLVAEGHMWLRVVAYTPGDMQKKPRAVESTDVETTSGDSKRDDSAAAGPAPGEARMPPG